MKPGPAPQRFAPPAPARSAQDVWELAITGELNDKAGDLVGKLVEMPFRSTGLIYFDSAGGSVFVGLCLASVLRLRGLKVTGVVAGECSSAALLPFAACQRRLVTPHSSLYFHPMRWQSEEEVRLEEATEWARHFRVLEEDLDALLARLFGRPVDQMKDWTHPGRFLSGIELVDAGLAEMVDLFSGDVWLQLRTRPPVKPG